MLETFSIEVTMEPETRAKAEAILSEMGIPVSVAVYLLYTLIIARNGLPFDVHMPGSIDTDGMSREEDDAISLMTLNDLRNGKAVPFEEFVDKIREKYNIPTEDLMPKKDET
ncbi:MAG: type II toxin-antitoxin system RelB/DinJ family antitoxin [Clostridia bacterium]|nr:type II toxin-antitoxin system RelB/DinJ family antitoxin [Clostridia bacterium]